MAWNNGGMSDTTPVAADQALAARADAPQAPVERAQVSIRRAPKISVFLILGALVGFLGTLILTALQPVDPAIGFAALFGYFLIYGIPAGVVLGGIIAVIFDRVSHRTAKIVPAERLVTEQPEQPEAATEQPGALAERLEQPEQPEQPE